MADVRGWSVDVTEVEKRRTFSASMLSLGTALAIASTAPVSDKTKFSLFGCALGGLLIGVISSFVEEREVPPPPEVPAEVTDFSIVKE